MRRASLAALLLAALPLATACDDDDAPSSADAAPDGSAEVIDAAVVPDAIPPDASPLPFCTEGGAMYDCIANGAGDCFLPPSHSATRSDGVTASELGCGAPTLMMSTGTIAVTGVVTDAFNQDPLVASVDVSTDFDFSAPLATATSDATGAYGLTLPTGTPSRLSWRVQSAGHRDSYTVSRAIVVNGSAQIRNLFALTEATVGTLAALVNLPLTANTPLVFGLVLDCGGHAVDHAVVTLSTASSAGDVCPSFVTGVQTIYFSTQSPNLPAHRYERIETNTDGQFLLFNLPPLPAGQTYLVQAWVFPTAADEALGFAGLKLLAEEPIPALADSVVLISTLPNQ